MEYQIGDFIKIRLSGESFWLEVVGVGESAVLGRVDNDLLNSEFHGVVCGDYLIVNELMIIDHAVSDDSEDHY